MEYNCGIRIYCTSPHREPKPPLLKIRKLSVDWQKTVQRKWLGGGGDMWERVKGTVFMLSKLEPGCLCSSLVLALCWGDWIMGTWESVSPRSLNSALNIPNPSYEPFLFVAISGCFWIYIVIKVQSQQMLITPSSFLLLVSFLKPLVILLFTSHMPPQDCNLMGSVFIYFSFTQTAYIFCAPISCPALCWAHIGCNY